MTAPTFLAFSNRSAGLRLIVTAGVLALSLGTALAQVAFDAPDADFKGRARAGAAQQGEAVYSGSEVKVTGQNFKPGQSVTISRGTQVLGDGAVTADPEGKFEAKFKLPDDAALGTHPLVLTTIAPYYAEIVDLKISPRIALSGEDKFEVTSGKPGAGLYQSAYSAKGNALFVTSSAGRPPEVTSSLLKLNPETLAVEASATPAAAPARKDGAPGGVFAVYGVGVDDANGTVWATNTRQDTVSVYNQSDLSLVKQFEPGTVEHARDVVIDEKHGKAYVSSTGAPRVAVLDTKSLDFVKYIEIESTQRGENFSAGSLQLDPASGKLYTVSLTTGEAAIIDVASDSVEKVFKVEGARVAIGVAHDAETDRIFVAGQGTDNLLIVDAKSGKTLSDVAVGAGALNVAFDPALRLAFVSSRDAGTVTVVDPDGNIVANLENAPQANHVVTDGKGTIYAVNKGRGEDPQSDRISRIVMKK